MYQNDLGDILIAEKQETLSPKQTTTQRFMPWLNLVLAIILISLGIWYLAGKVSLAEIAVALSLADLRYIALGLVVMLFTLLLKAWRWRLLLVRPEDTPPLAASFWAMMLGQYVNLLVPFMRLGEIARIYALNRQTGTSKGRSLGTLVVEKALDLLLFTLTIALLLPLIILPEFVGDPGLALGLAAFILLLILYLLAYQTERMRYILQALASRFPFPLWQRLLQLGLSGLEGLSALRSRRLTLALILSSAVLAFLGVLLPYVLFPAFGLPLGLAQAALVHVVVSIAIAPPSTPAKIGVFNGAVAFLLLNLGVEDEAAVLGYAIVFHLVVLLPQIILGGIAASRTRWRWRKTVEQQTVH